VSVGLSLIVVVSMVGFYVASAKNEGGGSPWESILDVFVTGGSVEISSPVVLEAGTHVDVSGSIVDVSGSSVDVSGSIVDVSGSSVDVSGSIVDVSGSSVDVSGSSVDVSGSIVDVSGSSVDVSGSVSLESGSEVGVSGEVSLEAGTEVGVSGEVSITGPVTIDGPVTLAPGSTVEALMATKVVELLHGNMVPLTTEGYTVDVDGYKTVHIYFIYSPWTYPDAYSLSMTLLIPDPHGGNPIAWQSESLPGPGVYSYEVTGPELYLHLHGWAGADVTECKLFVYAQSD